MAPFAFRYTLVDEKTDADVLRWIVEKSPGHLVVKHGADADVNHDHWHAMMWVDKKLDALRKDWIKSKPDAVGKGNAAYSLTMIEKRTDEDPVEVYERYMCHGACHGDKVEVVSSHGLKYSADWFHQQHELYWAKNTQMKKKEVKAVHTKSMVNDVLKRAEEAGVTDRRAIAKIVLDMHMTDRKPLNVFYGRGVINTVWALVNGREAREYLIDELTR